MRLKNSHTHCTSTNISLSNNIEVTKTHISYCDQNEDKSTPGLGMSRISKLCEINAKDNKQNLFLSLIKHGYITP